MKCEAVTSCKHKAGFKMSTDKGMVKCVCGKHLLKMTRAMRPAIRRGHVMLFTQKFMEGP